ncbi:hypothetical protein BJ684DRAFT_20224 [Piptocephalis cylindrospora]|uniref:Uncharacterized protein n=1 Tax=Piptocephalis cylindrospora TaxID=1907219 RepID=A0A4P9Y2X6_9FUNG|nr:hypothetical protein BJ684DRAFT_20224 [Piptocephalis cylindrospora]|eukprot:RKP13268.1 hypothetical protein BJ684DRAFT_20224 [Piptocephalis cylindrospora]
MSNHPSIPSETKTIHPKGRRLLRYWSRPVIFILWILYVLSYLLSLELVNDAVKRKGTDVGKGTMKLLGVMGIVLTQGQGPVTGLLIASWLVDTLTRSRIRPENWSSLLELSDGTWSGPFGWVSSLIRSRGRRSGAWLIAAVLSAISLLIPFLIERAYPVAPQSITIPQALPLIGSGKEEMGTVESYLQMSLGRGIWTTSFTLDEQLRSYVSNQSEKCQGAWCRDGARFYGQGTAVEGKARVFGMRQWLECGEEFSWEGNDLGECRARAGPPIIPMMNATSARNAQVNVTICGAQIDSTNAPQAKTDMSIQHVAVLMREKIGIQTSQIRGIGVECQAQSHLGFATVDFKDHKFLDFEPVSYSEIVSQGGEPLANPLAAAAFAWQYRAANTVIDQPGYMAGLGYPRVLTNTPGATDFNYEPLKPGAFRMSMIRAFQAMAVAPSLTNGDTKYVDGEAFLTVQRREPEETQRVILIIALILWGLGGLLLSAFSLRRRWTDTMDTYCSARLLVEYPHIMEGYSAGSMWRNPKLRENMDSVGDCSHTSDQLGHIGIGGRPLDSSRRYV